MTDKNSVNNDIMDFDEWMHKFALKLDRLRRRRGLSVNELGRLSGISPTSIKRYLNEKGLPTSYTVYCLSKALDCTVSALMDF